MVTPILSSSAFTEEQQAAIDHLRKLFLLRRLHRATEEILLSRQGYVMYLGTSVRDKDGRWRLVEQYPIDSLDHVLAAAGLARRSA